MSHSTIKNYTIITKFYFLFSSNNNLLKRQATQSFQNNLFVEYLVVIDNNVYNDIASIYSNLPQSQINDYINIFFANIINGVSKVKFNRARI